MLRRSERPHRAFTLLEGLAAAALLAVGITACMTTLGAIAGAESRAREQDKVQRLALQKYDELISTNQQALASQSGDFADRNMSGYTWNLDLEQSQVNNLDTVVVTVQKQNPSSRDPKGVAEGLIYISPTTTSSTTTTTGASSTGGG
jgi:type II secretory pathway pseudopilin PulG